MKQLVAIIVMLCITVWTYQDIIIKQCNSSFIYQRVTAGIVVYETPISDEHMEFIIELYKEE